MKQAHTVQHMTINGHWGYCAGDDNHKSTRTLIHNLVRSASIGANYLLNVGPTAEGEILPVHAKRLHEMGMWLAENGEGVYGTRAGMIAPTADIVSTSGSNGDTYYVHLLNYASDCVRIENPTNTTYQASLLCDGSAVKCEAKEGWLALTVPSEQRDPMDKVVKLTTQ
jgi:alpha-L-fucosidase